MLRVSVTMVWCLVSVVAGDSQKSEETNTRFLTPQQQANIQNIFPGASVGHQGGGHGTHNNFGGHGGSRPIGGHGGSRPIGGHGGSRPLGGHGGSIGGHHGGSIGGHGGSIGGHHGGIIGGHEGSRPIGGHGGSIGGHGGSIGGGHHGRPCRYWCRRSIGYQCCDNLTQPTKPGQCPPQRAFCPGLRLTGPQYCEDDYDCSGVDKCCPDVCLPNGNICKPPNSYGR